MISDAYEELRKKYRHLPSFEELDHDFEISTLESEKFLLRAIKKRMAERLDDVSSTLGDIIHPSSESIALMYEWRFFDPKEKKGIVALFRRVQFLLRAFCEADLIQDDEIDSRLIADSHKAWKEVRKECLPLVKRLKDAWTRETEYKEDLGYLG